MVPKNFRYFLETKNKTKQTKQVTSIFPPASCFFQHLLGPQVPPRVQKTPGWVQSPVAPLSNLAGSACGANSGKSPSPTWLKSGINSPEGSWNPIIYMGVSKNRGVSPKMDGENNGKPYWNGWFGGTTIFGNTHMGWSTFMFGGQTSQGSLGLPIRLSTSLCHLAPPLVPSMIIHVSYIYLHLVDFCGTVYKCR